MRRTRAELADAEAMAAGDDAEMRALAEEETHRLKAEVRELYSAPELHLGAGEVAIVAEAARRGVEVVELGAAAFRSVAGAARADGLLGVIGRWPTDLARLRLGPDPLVVVAEAVERPGNLGTIVRSTCAAGASEKSTASGAGVTTASTFAA